MEKLTIEEAQHNEKKLAKDVTALGNLLYALEQAKSVGKTDELLELIPNHEKNVKMTE